MMIGSLPRFLICCALFCVIGGRAAGQWTSPAAITTGPHDDIHSAFASVGSSWYFGPGEWLAFTRSYGSWSGICVKTTTPGSTWDDSVSFITNDSSWNDHPTIAQTYNRLMLVWQRDSANSDISYSYNAGGGWSPPIALTTDGAGNRSPNVEVYDTTFIVVWEKAGRIVFSKFLGGNWTSPAFVTPAGDTLNTSPQVYASFGNPPRPVIVWEKKKPADTSHTITYSVLYPSGQSTPDTIAWTGDNRQPRSMKQSPYGAYFTYESNRTGHWEIYSANGFFFHDTLEWSDRSYNMSQNPSADNVDASLSFVPIITDAAPSETGLWNTSAAGTWRVVSGASDSIAAADNYGREQYLTPAFGTTDRNPDISVGMFVNDRLRVWTVWENNVNGHWNLYGSHVDIVLDVGEYGSLPSTIRLHQNYPNPFNPTTAIRFDLPEAGNVSLVVFDLLGRKVAELANGYHAAGHHSATWDAADRASGVYFARLVVTGVAGEGKHAKVNKLVLMK